MTITSNPVKKSLWTSGIIAVAIKDSFVKLNPRTLMKNPVMFVVEVGSVVTSVELISDLVRHNGDFGFELQITLWLWFTVLFANFAEAMAEGRGKAQGETLGAGRNLARSRSGNHGQAHEPRWHIGRSIRIEAQSRRLSICLGE